jgi:hypothetical protein
MDMPRTKENEMTDDRRTKAQILADLAKSDKENMELRERIASQPALPSPVPVAVALQGAIRALDPIAKSPSRSLYTDSEVRATADLVGVMKHLLHRYQVDLVEHRTEPCNRQHLDEATEQELVSQLRHGGVF